MLLIPELVGVRQQESACFLLGIFTLELICQSVLPLFCNDNCHFSLHCFTKWLISPKLVSLNLSVDLLFSYWQIDVDELVLLILQQSKGKRYSGIREGNSSPQLLNMWYLEGHFICEFAMRFHGVRWAC